MQKFQNELGSGFNFNGGVCFFGSHKSSNVKKLEIEFSQFQFSKIKQTHSNIIVPQSFELIEADAHFTEKKNMALLIATADCMPIMIWCSALNVAMSIHAGWRGVENRIVEKAVQILLEKGSTAQSLNFWIGPHIQIDSFEVSEDVFQLLSKSQYGLIENQYSNYKGSKYYVDLNQIVLSQLRHHLNADPKIEFINDDTKTNMNYHSFRRGKATSERNYSFIALY